MASQPLVTPWPSWAPTRLPERLSRSDEDEDEDNADISEDRCVLTSRLEKSRAALFRPLGPSYGGVHLLTELPQIAGQGITG